MGKSAKPKRMSEVSGNICLSSDKKQIRVNLLLRVSDSEFKYGGRNYYIEEEVDGVKYKGLVFSYFHSEEPGRCDGDIFDDSPRMLVEEEITDDNFVNWNDNDEVRILALNEVDYFDFIAMRAYFKKYVRNFKTRGVTASEFDGFNSTWNGNNEDYQVNVCSDDDTHIKKPRYTKDGGILNLRFCS